MPTIEIDCIRCGAIKSTIDCYSCVYVSSEYSWMRIFEVSGVCRSCHKSSIFLLNQSHAGDEYRKHYTGQNALIQYSGSLADIVEFRAHIVPRDYNIEAAPEHLPEQIGKIIQEGNTCLSARCWNAAGAMYRLVLDITTKSLVPEKSDIEDRDFGNLSRRTTWLLNNGYIDQGLSELANCIRQNGNDAAHDGSLSREDAYDLKDFCYILVERVYIEGERLRLANERRLKRRQNA